MKKPKDDRQRVFAVVDDDLIHSLWQTEAQAKAAAKTIQGGEAGVEDHWIGSRKDLKWHWYKVTRSRTGRIEAEDGGVTPCRGIGQVMKDIWSNGHTVGVNARSEEQAKRIGKKAIEEFLQKEQKGSTEEAQKL